MPLTPMDAVYHARRENLRLLAAKYEGQHTLADKLDITRSYLSQLIGKTPTKNISEATARGFEAKLALQAGFLDIARGAQ